jgi:hypothetical protein
LNFKCVFIDFAVPNYICVCLKEEEMETSEDEEEKESPKPPFLRETLSGRNPKPPKR